MYNEQSFSDIYNLLKKQSDEILRLNESVTAVSDSIPTVPLPQPSNLIRNASFSHSAGSWINSATADDRRYECKYWFSHPDTANIAMSTADYSGGSPNYTLKSSAHTGYDASKCHWIRDKGIASMIGNVTLDAQLFNFPAQPSFTVYTAIFVALKNQYVTCPTTARIFCGIYAKESATWQYLQAAFTPAAQVIGTVSTPTSRDYLVHIRTDRGFTVQSSAITVASAPSNTDFTNGARVLISWPSPLKYGVLYADIYRKTGGTYELLESVATGLTTYIDNNSVLSSAGGYPSADFTKLVAYTATRDGVLTNLAVDGVDPSWDTIPFAVPVPALYDLTLSDPTSFQYVRWGITGLDASGRFDVMVTDGVTNGTTTATSAAAQFQTSGWAGKTITLVSGANSHTTTINAVGSTTSLTLDVACPFTATDVTVTISGGGGTEDIILDLARASYGENAIFAFNSEDLSSDRGVPVAFPNGSTQGGSGTGSGGTGGDGEPLCVWEDEIIHTTRGKIRAIDVNLGDIFIGHEGQRNKVNKIKVGASPCVRIVTESGHTATTSDTHKYLTGALCTGRAARNLKVGDVVLTDDGISKITEKEHLEMGIVVKFSLSPGHTFMVGEKGIASHNRKNDDPGNF